MSERKRVATYARVSLGVQVEEGRSLSAQEAEMREFAEARGWEVVDEFVDAGETGTNTERPGLQAALEAVGRGEFDVLLVHELSRLSRSLRDTLNIFEALGRMDVGFAAVKDPDFNFYSTTGRLFLTVVAALNQYYVDTIRMHTAKSKRDRARRGLYNSPVPPYGYRQVGDADTPPEIVEEEAEVVRDLFERYAMGQHSYRDLANWINEAGYHTRSGSTFSKDTVAEILRNPFYKGEVAYKQRERSQEEWELYAGRHEAIVSEEVWEVCRRMRERKRIAPRTYQPEHRVYLLNGLVYCDVCERKLRAQGVSSGDYYREIKEKNDIIDCPDAGHGVRAERVDGQIGAIFRQLELPEDWREELAEMMEQNSERKSLEDQRAQLVEDRRRLKVMGIRGVFDEDPEVFDQELERIRRELAALPAPVDLKTMERSAQVVEKLAEVWDEAEKVDCRDLLRLAVRKITVDVPQARVVTIEPKPIFVPLLRKVPVLREIEFGVFSPVWPAALVEELGVIPIAKAVTRLPDVEDTPDWPLVVDLPADVKGKSITPLLSAWLKDRRERDEPLGPVVALENLQVPPLKVDRRYWDTEIELIDSLSHRPDGSAAFLWMPFVLQREEGKEELLVEAQRVVKEGGLLVVVDVLPSAMGAHWLYRYFPEAWEIDRDLTWNAFELYNRVREVGFEVDVERKSLYQPVTVGVALEMVKDRKRCPQLALLPDIAYEEGVQRLEAMAEREGKGHKLSSEVCLVMVRAEKQSSGKAPRSE